MNMKRIAAAVSLVAFSIPAHALFDSLWRVSSAKYKPGDCITATDQSLSFYGHYARVEGVIDFDGVQGPGVYSLYFPVFVPRTSLFSQSLDARTERVSGDFCVRQQVD